MFCAWFTYDIVQRARIRCHLFSSSRAAVQCSRTYSRIASLQDTKAQHSNEHNGHACVIWSTRRYFRFSVANFRPNCIPFRRRQQPLFAHNHCGIQVYMYKSAHTQDPPSINRNLIAVAAERQHTIETDTQCTNRNSSQCILLLFAIERTARAKH